MNTKEKQLRDLELKKVLKKRKKACDLMQRNEQLREYAHSALNYMYF